ncbi:hypothetical protein [Vibrio coralliilyticus]|uniref:hypothetical protein n=1 Tax=Vibrio coralliilyticus TaxID=190893 RepID=UPI000BAAA312|nr:hypothetical protein [Vibrio coralliilyticus]NOI30341.1 hypothetical protein [Vibrio coralliilyticus]NOI49930.1 hypothetical protein [Vibrio coralliilyticus]NOI59161.1 hypothetical protein [Vibrio coralliilyticus]PAT66215.1 hypothetical protein CKA27_20550 [Vibrio coralliilyticus]
MKNVKSLGQPPWARKPGSVERKPSIKQEEGAPSLCMLSGLTGRYGWPHATQHFAINHHQHE